ncbi:MAG: HAMP domain-containing protein [Spirochaetes bacterium]|nr:HAMP domain-containing protein [Spirochaetota bacterium]
MGLKKQSKLINPGSITYRIFLSYSFLIIVIISGLLIFTNKIIEETYIKSIENNLINTAYILEDDISKTSETELQNTIRKLSGSIGDRITLIDAEGKVKADSFVSDPESLENHYYRPELQAAREKTTGSSLRFSSTISSRMLYVAKISSKKDFYIRISRPMTEIDTIMMKINRLIILVGLSAFIVSLFFNIIISKKISNPVRKTILFAENFAAGNFSHRIVDFSSDELGILQRSLNRLADNLETHIYKLTVEREKLSVTLETISDPIVVIDNEGYIILSNNAFRILYNLKDDPSGRKYYEIIRGTKLNSRIAKAINRQTDEIFEHKFSRERIFDIFLSTISGSDSLAGMLIVFHDISEKKQIEQMKTDLVGNLSHELKTPIAIIKGYLETIQMQQDNAELRKDFISRSISNLDRQNAIINDMLKLNRLETSGEFEFEEIDINEIVSSCLASLTPKIVRKSISVRNSIDMNCRFIHANKFLTEQLIFNVIDNAINYNKEGGEIIISLASDDDNRIRLVFEDTGIGIPDESIDRIFERFYRVDKGRSRSTGGTGLGLAIVKHAAEIQNWIIMTESLSAKINGTRFTFLIPVNDSFKH